MEPSNVSRRQPLLRALTFPHVGLVLALAQGSVRLLEVVEGLAPAEVHVPELPRDVASAAVMLGSRRLVGSGACVD